MFCKPGDTVRFLWFFQVASTGLGKAGLSPTVSVNEGTTNMVTVASATAATALDATNQPGVYYYDHTVSNTYFGVVTAQILTSDTTVLARNIQALYISVPWLIHTASGTASAGTSTTITLAGASATDSLYVGETVAILAGTGAGQARIITAYVGSTKVATVAQAWATTPDNTSVFAVLSLGRSMTAVMADGVVTAAAIADGAIDAGAIASNAITSAKIATDAIGAAQLAADAVTEIQSGLATASALATVQADTDDIQSRIPASLVSGRIDASVGAYQSGLTPLQPTTPGNTLDVTATGEAGIDWGNIGNKSTINILPNTSISVTQQVASVTGNVSGNVNGSVGSVTGNVGGNVVGSVGSVTAAVTPADGSITAAKFGAGAITASVIAADALTASALATDAVAEIQSGLSTLTTSDVQSALTAQGYTSARAGYLDTLNGLVAAIWAAATRTLTSFGTLAADVWAVATRTITGGAIDTNNDKTGYALTSGERGAIADGVWDEALAGHLTSGTTGAALNGAGAAGDPWGTALPGAYGAGTAGAILGRISAVEIAHSSPVATGGATTLYAGDDYATELGNQLTYTYSSTPADYSAATAVWRGGGVTKAASVSGNSTSITVTVALTTDETAAMPIRTGQEYQIEITLSSKKSVVIRGALNVYGKL